MKTHNNLLLNAGCIIIFIAAFYTLSIRFYLVFIFIFSAAATWGHTENTMTWWHDMTAWHNVCFKTWHKSQQRMRCLFSIQCNCCVDNWFYLHSLDIYFTRYKKEWIRCRTIQEILKLDMRFCDVDIMCRNYGTRPSVISTIRMCSWSSKDNIKIAFTSSSL